MKKKIFRIALVCLAFAIPVIAAVTNNFPGVSILDRADILRLVLPVKAITIAASGDGGEGSYTVSTPDKSQYTITCSDTDGCGLYFSDTGAVPGQVITFLNVSSNAVTAREVSGKLEGTATLGATDTLVVEYLNSAYHKIGGSDN